VYTVYREYAKCSHKFIKSTKERRLIRSHPNVVFCYGVVLKTDATKVRIKYVYDVLEYWKITHSLFYLVIYNK